MPNGLRNAVGRGVGAGLGLGLGVGVVAALGGRGLRPLAKSVIRGGVVSYEAASTAAAEAVEVAQDLYHEVRDERAAEMAAREKVGADRDVVRMRSR